MKCLSIRHAHPGMVLSIALLSAVFTSTGEAQCTANEHAALLASDGMAQDQLGLSIAISGDTAVVGAWLDDNANGTDAGAAYVYERNQGGANAWGEVAKLTASDGAATDAFGWSVAIDGDTIVVGAYRNDTGASNAGKAYAFERNQGGANAWGEIATMQGTGAAMDDQFGYSVAVSGTIVAVGAHRADTLGTDSGTVFIFVRNQGGPGNYGQFAQVDASDGAADDFFGRAVAFEGTTLVVGALGSDEIALDTGAAYVFDQNLGGANNFGEAAKIVPADGATDDGFGFSVDVDGDTVVVGSYRNDEFGLDAGAAYVFDRDQGGASNWGQVAKLIGSESNNNDVFGYSVAIDGNLAVVGAYLEAGGGAGYTFSRNYGGADNWGQAQRIVGSTASVNDRFGFSVAISGTTAAVGATHEDVNGNNAGSGFVFTLTGGPINYCTAGTSAIGCQAMISASGTPSASAASGFTITVAGLEGQKDGLIFFGSNGRQANPWGSGTSFQCVVPPVVRTPLITGTGTTGVCDGVYIKDLNAEWCSTCPFPAKNPGVGALVQAQGWYRDPQNTSNQTTSLSNAIEFSVCP